jgi:beta propeller repeat protein
LSTYITRHFWAPALVALAGAGGWGELLQAAEVDTYPLTHSPITQYNACISGSIVVWSDYRNGNWDIYGMDIETGQEFPICTNEATQDLPYIDGHIVVWRDLRNGNWDIYGYNLETHEEFPVCTAPGMQWRPVVYGNLIVWQDRRLGDWDIIGYDMTRHLERLIAVAPGDQEFPSIYRDIVVWSDDRGNGGRLFTVSAEPVDESRPVIDGDVVVWRAKSDPPYWNIYAKRLSTGEVIPICTAQGDQWYANICGDIIVWDDRRSPSWDIYGYDLSTKTQFVICKYARDQLLPDVEGCVAVWHDLRDGVSNLWAADLRPLLTTQVSIGPQYLNPGAVWIAFPAQPLNPDPALILGEDVVRNRLQRWNPELKTIQTYPDDFTEVEAGTGYSLTLDRWLSATYTGVRTNGDQVINLRYAGWIWIGTSLCKDVELSCCLVRDNRTGQIRTALADRAAQSPWINWQFIYWDTADDMAKIVGLDDAGDSRVLRAWYGYRLWVCRDDIDLILPGSSP